MFKKEYSLRKTKDIENVFKNGKGLYSENLGIKFISNNLGYNRFCIIISAKISQKATERNKIKRRFKALVLKYNDKIKIGFDFLIIIKKNISHYSFSEVEKLFLSSFKKINILS